ncbi:unnamed protein product [Litomosoides sigmodontis]|uniref:Uncharacterized protein n=1 Tax=Litomosoides sigmodontis TaxID=42156 RepID=A0A3P6TV16_LITSI|nr:unnamed protein product [Litomosoides sigmodontis]
MQTILAYARCTDVIKFCCSNVTQRKRKCNNIFGKKLKVPGELHMSVASSQSNVDSCHRHSLTVESVHPMHLIASGKIHCQFSNHAATESQEQLMKKFSVTSKGQKDVYSAAIADKLEDQEVNNLRMKQSDESKNEKKE